MSDSAEWWTLPPTEELESHINAAIGLAFTNLMGVNITKEDVKDIVLKVTLELKDLDDRWIEYDHAPRNHKNPIYDMIYRKVYNEVIKQSKAKDVKPAIKKPKAPITDAGKDGVINNAPKNNTQQSEKPEPILGKRKRTDPHPDLEPVKQMVIVTNQSPNIKGKEQFYEKICVGDKAEIIDPVYDVVFKKKI